MDFTSLIPWSRTKSLPATRVRGDDSPFVGLHREMNRLFEDFFRDFDIPAPRLGWSADWPRVDIEDARDRVKVTAELPGMEAKDVTLSLREGVLTLRGEKKSHTQGPVYSERLYGRFERSFQLGPDVDPDKVSADFVHGVLTVTVEKKPEAERAEKRIEIKT